MEKHDAIAALVALGHETRLDIFRLLMQAGPKGLAAGQIGERLALPPATLSFHLSQLKHADLITFRRESRSLIYSAAYPVMNALLAYMTENCCQGATASCEAAAPSTCQPKGSHETSARARVR
ncbi:winged helix-turn-helix transcriptional regulator [Methylocystis sp. H4A]|uniref:ArsR/SmtB family transcription factor n=1 Tax=Methylocystis sp. H4A TaxID=2785788 RepID=UPI0018C2B44F|nr:metalloregulator ArsR/SmtB family transcription factor [Methylocystis sp. H4A]MBG0800703.1 winged helix-turn-helix transcriptional regulator [Methylocystis sp. H4A]